MHSAVVYIAGPISGLRELPMDEKLARFGRAEEWLSGLPEVGKVMNPLKTGNGDCCEPGETPKCNPQGHPGQHGENSHAWECYMKHDLRDLLTCDTIALLPGWTESKGASLEYKLARELGYRVIYLNEYGENINQFGSA